MSRLGESILRGCANLVTGRPWLVIAIVAILTVLAGFASLRLTVDTSTEKILSEQLPFRQVEIAYESAFPAKDTAIAVIDAPTPEEAETAARELAADIATRPQNFEWVEVAGSSPYFDRYGLLFLTPEEIAATAEELRQARRLLLGLSNDPSLRGVAELTGLVRSGVEESVAPASTAEMLEDLARAVQGRADGHTTEMQWRELLSDSGDEGTRRLVEMKPILDDTTLNRAVPALNALDEARATLRDKHPDVTVRVTGEPVLRQQELSDAFSGAAYASGLSFVLVAVSLIIGIRSGRLIVALLLTLVVGSIWTTGLAAMTVGSLNLISVAFLVLFFGLGVDFGTHLGLRHLEEARQGKPFREALVASMMGEGPSILLSAICAALAFLAFVPTSYTGLAEFGIISALGMLVAVIVTFTLQPALMTLMPPRPQLGRSINIGIGRWIERFHWPILIAAVLATMVAAWLSLGVQIDTNPLNLQSQRTEPVQTYRDLARDPDTSPYALNVVAPDFAAAGELAPRLEELSGVAGVRWIDDFIPKDQTPKIAAIAAARERLGEAFFAEDSVEPAPSDAELTEAFAEIKADAEAIAATPDDSPVDPSIKGAGQRLVDALASFEEKRGVEPATLRELGEALSKQMPEIVAELRDRFSVTEEATIEDIPTDMREEWLASDGRVRIRVLPEGDIGTPQQMKQFTERVQTVAPDASGAPASVTGAGQAILAAFGEAILYTVLSIGIVVAVLRRRVADVLLVLVPLAVAALWTMAASAGFNLPFNFANIIVIPLLIGLGVASSVHIVVRAHEVVQDNTGSHEEGMHVLDTSTPLAVLVAQLNTVAAFATLAVADHRGLFSMGVLLGLSIFFVLIVALVVLPAFMIAIGFRKSGPASGSPA
jgi:uncharacterized protein